MITLVALLVAAIVVIGLGAFLLSTRRTSETVSGSAGVAGDSSAATVVPPPSAAVTAAEPSNAEASTPSPATDAPALSTNPAATTVSPERVDNSASALADLELHFANHDRLDLEAAYTGLTTSFAPTFDDFVQFWSVAVASVDSPIDGCDVTGDRGVCRVRFFITYSDAAQESVRNRCVGQSVELTMQRTADRFLIDEQRDIGPLDCPNP